ncbi:MAG: hypothetical protein RL318_2664 [Fibrobacterota bacterium]|jgi:indole-3-glycerol phosphate synthase
MSLDNLSIEELYSEIERRKAADQAETRRALEEARKLVRELEAKLGESDSKFVRRAPAASASKSRITLGEKTERILTALEGRGFTGASELASLVGFDGNALRDALGSLTEEGKLVREGKARGTKYKLA